jgi:hypothetical protein
VEDSRVRHIHSLYWRVPAHGFGPLEATESKDPACFQLGKMHDP